MMPFRYCVLAVAVFCIYCFAPCSSIIDIYVVLGSRFGSCSLPFPSWSAPYRLHARLPRLHILGDAQVLLVDSASAWLVYHPVDIVD